MQLKIPKLRKSSAVPRVYERRWRIDQTTYVVIIEAYVHGVSTRSVNDLAAAPDVDRGISKSEVSRIGVQLDEELNEFRERPLLHLGSPVLSTDVTYVAAAPGGPAVSRVVVVAMGVGQDGRRAVLGITIGDEVDGAVWTEFLQSLRGRGHLDVLP